MRLREYEYILAIAREQNMSRAAESLFISQPALSRLLASVEEDLGQPLFIRSGREMIPTPFGKQYIENASQLVELNAQFEQKMRHPEQIMPEISIQHPMIYSDFITNGVALRMSELYPALTLHAVTVSQHKLLSRILSGEGSLALGIVTEEIASLLSYKNIGTQEMALVVPADHPFTRLAGPREGYTYPYLPVEALAEATFILPDQRSYSGTFATRFLQSHGIRPRIAMRTSFTGPVYRAVAASRQHVAILPSVPLRFMHLEEKLTYLSIRSDSDGDVIGLLYRRDHTLTGEELALVSVMRELYAQK